MSSSGWVVAMVRTGCEMSCVEWWSRRGITAYTPVGVRRLVPRPPRPAVDLPVPAFPGYAFLDARTVGGSAYRRAVGFVGLITLGALGLPLIASEHEVAVIRQRQAKGEFDGTRPAAAGRPLSFRAGDRVIVVSGPAEGACGLVEPGGRVRLDGWATPIKLDPARLGRG